MYKQPNNTQEHSYKLPHVTAAYTVRNHMTNEVYVGSTNNMNIRWKSHRKNKSEAHLLLERPGSYLVWYECKDLATARAMERAGYYAYSDAGLINVKAPHGHAEKSCMTAAEAKEKKKQRTVGWNQVNKARHLKHKADYRARQGQ